MWDECISGVLTMEFTNAKLVKDIYGNIEGVRVTSNGIDFQVPFDPDNTSYQKYLEWLAKGNEPLPADEPTV
jgi:hypothetical protein